MTTSIRDGDLVDRLEKHADDGRELHAPAVIVRRYKDCLSPLRKCDLRGIDRLHGP